MSVSWLAALALTLAWLLLAGYARFRHTRRRTPALSAAALTDTPPIAVIYASQGGTAAELAQRTALSLGERARVYPMSAIEPALLTQLSTALFVVSTYGEGDPPDMAQDFYRLALTLPAEPGLQHLQVGILALGDRSYQHFCGFALFLQQWLTQRQAQPLFDMVQVDCLDEAALQQWQTHLTTHLQAQAWQRPVPTRWRLAQRQHCNPGSQGGACYELRLDSLDTPPPVWQAGDIAHVRIGDTGQHRDYSIASIPDESQLRLLIRQHQHADGTPGLGSHWLTQALGVGDSVDIHLRSNTQFHLHSDGRPAIFIGNGTGLAGLRALIQARRQNAQRNNWLLFGERQRQHDFIWQTELQSWLDDGSLQHLDLAFSRDQADKHYVHHLLREAAPRLRDWVARGAVLYVCGSQQGMAQDVDHALQDALGAHGYHDLRQRGGYKRDVY